MTSPYQRVERRIMSSNEGSCRLCEQYGRLLESHYIPRSIYQLIRLNDTEAAEPIIIAGQSAVQTGRQVTSPLLCEACEDQFSKYGESWVLKHCFRAPGNFKLQDSLRGVSPIEGLDLFAAASISAIDVTKLIYFATSIFWRASAHTWASGRTQLKGIRLEEPY
jgi:hypothetical protein